MSQPIRIETTQSRTYRLMKPWVVNETFVEHEWHDHQVIVEPSMGSICHADLRYYSGQRRQEALSRKLPMALIHEGIGRVVKSRSSHLTIGQRVVIVPNIPGYLLEGIDRMNCCHACRSNQGENYCHRGAFLGSGTDGIAQNRLVIPLSCAIPIPDEVPDEIAVLTELCTVSYQALYHIVDKLQNARVAVFGDGPVGYVTAVMLHHMFGVTKDRLHVFGAIEDKLKHFEFATRSLVQDFDFSSRSAFDIALECTGGKFSESAINQAIDILMPGGELILMGVTEERVPMNTRDILEKR